MRVPLVVDGDDDREDQVVGDRGRSPACGRRARPGSRSATPGVRRRRRSRPIGGFEAPSAGAVSDRTGRRAGRPSRGSLERVDPSRASPSPLGVDRRRTRRRSSWTRRRAPGIQDKRRPARGKPSADGGQASTPHGSGRWKRGSHRRCRPAELGLRRRRRPPETPRAASPMRPRPGEEPRAGRPGDRSGRSAESADQVRAAESVGVGRTGRGRRGRGRRGGRGRGRGRRRDGVTGVGAAGGRRCPAASGRSCCRSRLRRPGAVIDWPETVALARVDSAVAHRPRAEPKTGRAHRPSRSTT